MSYNQNVVVLRARKGVPGVGKKMSRYFNAYEVTCNSKPAVKVPDGAVVINYGRSQWPVWYKDAMTRGVRILNTPDAVRRSVDKRLTLEILKENNIPCVDASTDASVAKQWLQDGSPVLVRHTATGKQGKGVEFLYPDADPVVPDAPLYTKFYDKTHEFRVHVVNGQVIDYVQKKRMGKAKREKYGLSESDMLLRNHKRGWVFAHNDIIRDKFVENLALEATKALGLDYAGIDILAKVDARGHVTNAVVCESNSAPGMSSSVTFNAYMNAFNQLIGGTNV